MSGLNLNPMFFWPQVKRWHEKSFPIVVFYKSVPNDLERWANENKLAEFILEDCEVSFNLQNVISRWRDKAEYKSWVESWAKVDYLVCDKSEEEYWLQAGLCGVKVIFDLSDFENLLPTLPPLTKIERIENWENTKKLLT